ncbi:MAG: hypothetical protein K8R99_07520 [Actinomycetia bacterium]|nr:hypothetical protein [Actinomycetes bacterium]
MALNTERILDFAALRRGGAIALVVGVPCAIGSSSLAQGDGDSFFVGLLWLGAVAGFVIGAGVAAWVQRKGTPLIHGMVCAGGTYAAVQVVFSIVRLSRGKDVSWLGLFFTFTVVLLAGIIGGGLGSMMQRRGITPGSSR